MAWQTDTLRSPKGTFWASAETRGRSLRWGVSGWLQSLQSRNVLGLLVSSGLFALPRINRKMTGTSHIMVLLKNPIHTATVIMTRLIWTPLRAFLLIITIRIKYVHVPYFTVPIGDLVLLAHTA